jgi:hypothetical protein
MQRSKGDIRVIGMVAGTHVIEDLGRDVPYRSLVIIPEAEALMSKDLWRAISQKSLLQLTSAPYPTPGVAPIPDSEKVRLEKYCAELEGHVLRLENENASLKRQLQSSAGAQAAKLDAILAAIKTGVASVPAPSNPRSGALEEYLPTTSDAVIDGSAPTFLPGAIVPRGLDARISIQGEESTSGGVSEAAERLRQLRKKGGTA